MTTKETKFCNDLETVSGPLADWARKVIREFSWSVEDVKIHIRNAAKIAGRA